MTETSRTCSPSGCRTKRNAEKFWSIIPPACMDSERTMDTLTPHNARREDLRLVTGRGRYASDWNLPNQLHAAVLRSDRAHADITRLDVSQALAHLGVKAVLTGNDV